MGRANSGALGTADGLAGDGERSSDRGQVSPRRRAGDWRGWVTSTAAAEARRPLIFISPFLCFVVAWIFTASRRPLWIDELYTLHIADQPTVVGIWRLLLTGVDQTPPGFYVLMRASIDLFGSSPLAMRLPALLGFLALAVFVYLVVHRRLGARAGLLAAVFPLATAAYSYSYNARSYALVLALVAAALFCWQSYVLGKRPRLSLVLLALAAVAAVSLHYYAVLALIPIAAGEATRSLIARRVDPRVWVALSAAVLPLAAFLPLMQASRNFATVFWTVARDSTLVELYTLLLSGPTLIVCGLLGGALAVQAVRRRRARRPSPRIGLTAPELTAALAFVVLPLVAAIVGELIVGAITPRYAIAGLIGVSLLFPAAASYLDDGRRRVATVVLLAITVALSLYQMTSNYRLAYSEHQTQVADLRLLERHQSVGGDVLVAEQDSFVELSHAAPQRLRRSLIYLSDPRMALRFTKTDSVDRGLLVLARFSNLKVQPYRAYLSRHTRLAILCSNCSSSPKKRRKITPGWGNWLVPALAATGRPLEVQAQEHHSSLLTAPSPGQGAVRARQMVGAKGFATASVRGAPRRVAPRAVIRQ